MDIKLIIFSVFGGLALFLFGMRILSNSLQTAFGDRLKALLERLTDNKLKGVGVGALVTSIIQSSSITTVTLVGLINAGLITLNQSVPVIMGANIGTTVTAQLVAFKIGKYALPIIAIGYIISVLSKKDSWKHAGRVMLGFGILFLGMELMSSEVKHLAKDPRIINLLAEMGKNPLLGVLVAMVFTETIQSSSATTGLVISMAMGPNKLIDLHTAIPLILGANIGTCITVVIASIGSTLSSKRAAASHVLFNIIGVSLFLPFLAPYTKLIASLPGDLPRQIANAHTIFNVTVTSVLLPLSGYLVKLVTFILPGEEIKIDKGTKYIDERTLSTPPIAVSMAEKETIHMAQLAYEMIESSKKALFEKDEKEIAVVREKELVVDDLDDKIEVFLSKISKTRLSKRDRSKIAVLLHAISDIERIADHANNICENAELRIRKKVKFSEEAFKEMDLIFDKALTSLKKCMDIIMYGDENTIREVMKLEQEVDELVIEYEKKHYDRLEEGKCTPEAGPIYMDVLRNLERITDHTHNIAAAKRFGF